MMRPLRNNRNWITFFVIHLVLAIPQPGSAQDDSSNDAGLRLPAQKEASPTESQWIFSKPLSVLKDLKTRFHRKNDSEQPKLQRQESDHSHGLGDINPFSNAKFQTAIKTETPLRSKRYTAIPIRPMKRFSDLQSTSARNRSFPKPIIHSAKYSKQKSERDSIPENNIRRLNAETSLLPLPPRPGQVASPQSLPSDGEGERWMKLKLNELPISNRLSYSSHNGKISLVVRDAPISSVIGLIAQQNGLNIVANSDVVGNVTVTLTDVSLDDALSSILLVNGYIWTRSNNVLLVSGLSNESASSPLAQGKEVQVFALNYVSASEIDRVVKGLLSPIGQSFITETSPTEKLKTREQIVIEDLPEYVARIAQYIEQVDFPPQQVYIEAHVLQITLQDDNRHGVNFQEILRFGNSQLTLQTAGFADPTASPAFFLGLNSTDLTALVELLKTTTDSKTLASPKIMVLNGQEARIQIGEQLGYFVTTTTQTSTLQEVNFLDLGVVLKVTPQITDNNQILMTVKPEVSSGRINPLTNLPEEDTTEVETTIMLNDGQGMIIGGLIKETDIDTQSKIPIMGDLWGIGKLFQKRTVTRERSEIIIALIPRVVPCPSVCLPGHDEKLMQATTPLFRDNLRTNNRPWEPQLPDAMYNPRKMKIKRLPQFILNLGDTYPHPPEFYFPAVSEYSDPIFGGSHEIEPTVLSAGADPFPEFLSNPEFHDAE